MIIIFAYEAMFIGITWIMGSLVKGLWDMDDRVFARLLLAAFSLAFFPFMLFLMVAFWYDPVVQMLK